MMPGDFNTQIELFSCRTRLQGWAAQLPRERARSAAVAPGRGKSLNPGFAACLWFPYSYGLESLRTWISVLPSLGAVLLCKVACFVSGRQPHIDADRFTKPIAASLRCWRLSSAVDVHGSLFVPRRRSPDTEALRHRSALPGWTRRADELAPPRMAVHQRYRARPVSVLAQLAGHHRRRVRRRGFGHLVWPVSGPRRPVGSSPSGPGLRGRGRSSCDQFEHCPDASGIQFPGQLCLLVYERQFALPDEFRGGGAAGRYWDESNSCAGVSWQSYGF
jgi:hypothetical protein